MKVFWNKDLADPADPSAFDFAQGQDFGSGLRRPLNASSCQRALKMVWWKYDDRLIGRAHCCLLHSDAILSQSTGWMSVMVHTGRL
jgi:hypothetical protein